MANSFVCPGCGEDGTICRCPAAEERIRVGKEKFKRFLKERDGH